jgi:hypothetical protein
VAEIDVSALKLELDRSRAARLRAWTALGELRAILTAAGQELPKPREKSLVLEGEILERALKKALSERDETLRELAAAARWVDRTAFKENGDFGQAHQALLQALGKAGRFV